MSNIHEYVIFDRAKVDPALAMRWPEFDQTYPGWYVWESAREFLVESVLNETQILPYDVGIAALEQPETPLMLPGLPGMKGDEGADCIEVSQSRRVIAFLLRAWRERWPLHGEGQTPRKHRTIRCCAVADGLVRALRKRRPIIPCIFRWFEC